MPAIRYFQCPRCQHRAFTVRSLLRHFSSSHGLERNWICDLGSCSKTYKSLFRFREHILAKHINEQPQHVTSDEQPPAANPHLEGTDNIGEDVASAVFEQVQEQPQAIASTSASTPAADLPAVEGGLGKRLASLILKWKEARRLPESTINEIVGDIFVFLHSVGPHLAAIPHSDVESHINMEVAHLCTRNGRETFWEDAFDYVHPVTMYLDEPGAARESYQYVPILDTLKHYLEWCGTSITMQTPSSTDYLSCVFDGSAFKEHTYFCGDYEKLCLHLYTDEFEICNPIGPHRLKHKLMAIYYTVLNVPPIFRTHTDHIHLALVCKDKYIEKHGFDKILERLHQDIAHLETEGISVHG
ncbi:uncharacterized protein LOC135372066 [Ornithodoros turicata]|uniref:uncharacterized protein LOC135372066 n=1 Tax=Ornithodoros turicata TaxID=34597 RepID=UPI0031387E08